MIAIPLGLSAIAQITTGTCPSIPQLFRFVLHKLWRYRQSYGPFAIDQITTVEVANDIRSRWTFSQSTPQHLLG